jgi:hypothetical protein
MDRLVESACNTDNPPSSSPPFLDQYLDIEFFKALHTTPDRMAEEKVNTKLEGEFAGFSRSLEGRRETL